MTKTLLKAVILGVIGLWASAVQADACNCMVSDLSGSININTTACTLFRVLSANSGTACPNISFDPKLTGTINLDMVVPLSDKQSLVGNGQVTLATSAAFASSSIIRIGGDHTGAVNPSVSNLSIQAPATVMGVELVAGSKNHSLSFVSVSGASIAVSDASAGLSVSQGTISNSTIGFQGSSATGGSISNVTFDKNATAVSLPGSKYTLSGNSITNSSSVALQLAAGSTIDIFDNNTFSGNTSAIVMNGGNSNMPPAAFLSAVHPKGDNTHMTLVAVGLGFSTVKAYLADSATAAQGMKLIGSSTTLPSTGMFLSDIYKIDVSGVDLNSDIVLIITHPDLGSSAFSEKFKLSSKIDEAADACLSISWFQKTLQALYTAKSNQSVWAQDSDVNVDGSPNPDGFTNGAEDKNQDCKIDAGETDPACGDASNPQCVPAEADDDKDGVPNSKDNCVLPNKNQTDLNKNGIGDACEDSDGDGLPDDLSDAPGSVKDNCPTVSNKDQIDSDNNTKGDACEDFDGDGILNVSDNCPMVANADQDDKPDYDGIGSACDPDMDNDGLSNFYCDPSYTLDGKDHSAEKSGVACSSGFDQEGSANKGKIAFAGAVTLDPKNPDSDGDGYCDGPGSGPIDPVSHQPKFCTKGSGDNCPRNANSQWDDDEDGIGNACDLSPWATQGGDKALVDSDGDGVKDYQANGGGDNCPWIANPVDVDTNGDGVPDVQRDTDGDGRGDACDADDDNDGLSDVAENSARVLVLDPANNNRWTWKMLYATKASSYGSKNFCDGIAPDYPGGVSTCVATTGQIPAPVQPLATCPFLDDAGFANIIIDGVDQNCLNGPILNKADVDGDGILNAKDNCPTIPNKDQRDLDKDGVGDACDYDADGDLVPDWYEDQQHTHAWEADSDHYKDPSGTYDKFNDSADDCPADFDPKQDAPCKNGNNALDTDKDGKPDNIDNCPKPTKDFPNSSNPDQLDTDGDGKGDVCDDDVDGDGSVNGADKCPMDKTNTCVVPDVSGGGGGGGSGGGGTGGNNQSFQGGGGTSCTLTPNAAGTPTSVVLTLMALLPMVAMRARRNA